MPNSLLNPHWDTGKYAAFVLAAYAVSLVVLLAVVVQTLVDAWRWRRAAMKGEAARGEVRRAGTRPDGGRPDETRQDETRRDGARERPAGAP